MHYFSVCRKPISPVPGVRGWIDLFPLVSITVFKPIHFEVGDGDVKSQSTFVIDQKEIREGELEVSFLLIPTGGWPRGMFA